MSAKKQAYDAFEKHYEEFEALYNSKGVTKENASHIFAFGYVTGVEEHLTKQLNKIISG